MNWRKLHDNSLSSPGVSKVFSRRAKCGGMNICGAAFDYNSGREPISIHFMNQGMRAGQNLIKGCTWPMCRTLDIPDLAWQKMNGFGCTNTFILNYILHPSLLFATRRNELWIKVTEPSFFMKPGENGHQGVKAKAASICILNVILLNKFTMYK